MPTDQNLKDAFAGESQANRKYLAFAKKAEQEKLNCREGVDQSQVLIGLSFYLGDDPKWKDSLGGAWSLERLVDLEHDPEDRHDLASRDPRTAELRAVVAAKTRN